MNRQRRSDSHSAGIFALLLCRELAVINLTRRNIDDELGELGGIAGAFAVILRGQGE